MPVLGPNYRRDLEIHRYPILVYALVPLAALVLQAWLPWVLRGYAWFDLPLVITVYFALARRNPIQGTLLGAGLGIFQDGLTPVSYTHLGHRGACRSGRSGRRKCLRLRS